MTSMLFKKSKYIFALSLLYSFGSIFFGLDYEDTFYHLNISRVPDEFLSILSSYLNLFFIKITGGTLIYLRFINFLLYVFPFFLFSNLVKNKEKYYLISALILVIITSYNFNVLGYDSYSIFFIQIVFYFIVKYIENQSTKNLFFIVLFSALAILSRLPNVLILFFVCFTLLLNKKISTKTYKYDILIYFFLTVFLSIILFLLLDLITPISYFLPKAGHHHISNLIMGYLHDLGYILIFVLFFYILYWIFMLIYEKQPKIKFKFSRQIALIVVIFGFFAIVFVQCQIKSLNFSLMISAATFVYFLLNFKIIYNTKSFKTEQVLLISYLLFCFIMPAGSNTGLMRLMNLLPILGFIFVYSNLTNKIYFYFSLVFLFCFALVFKLTITYQDSNLIKLSHSINVDKLEQIYTTKEKSKLITQIDFDKKKYENEGFKVYFYGDQSHVFNYLYGNNQKWTNDFFNILEDYSYLTDLLNVTKSNKTVLFIIALEGENQNNILIQKLEKNNFKKTDKKNYFVLTKNN